MLRQGGTHFVVGYGGTIEVPTVHMIINEIAIVGSLVGNYTELVELMELNAEGRVNMRAQEYSLDDINTAITDFKNRQIVGAGSYCSLVPCHTQIDGNPARRKWRDKMYDDVRLSLPDTLNREVYLQTVLEKVLDPELDEPILKLGFVKSIEAESDHLTIELHLPTYWCAPNFSYMMAEDTRRELLLVEGLHGVTVRLKDHFAARGQSRRV